jgi:predicted negative regulator of RcsB-dependent stress response
VEIYQSENEQVEALRRWWEQNAKFVIVLLVLVIASVLGWRQWQAHRESQARAASDAYQQVLNSRGDPVKTLEAGRALVSEYPKSEYAVLASLAMAAAAVEQDDLDSAAAHLRFAMANSDAPGNKQVAALRLARVLLAQQKPKDAEQVLAGTSAEGFQADFDDVRGDIALALGDRGAARTAYQKALTGYAELPAKASLVKMKLDDLAEPAGEKK